MDEITKIIKDIKDLPAMPNIVIQALNLMKDPNVGMKQLGDVICYDQSLSIKVLNLVNSSYYGFAQQITSISRALALLGMNKAKSIIVTIAMKPMFASPANKELWRHCLTVAVGCELLASHFKLFDIEEAFINGFMHDIGKIILNMQDAAANEKVKEIVDDGSDIIEVERMFFGVDHTVIGAQLAKKWQLPVLLTNAIMYHHNPTASSIPVECSLVYLVNTLVKNNFKETDLNMSYISNLKINLEQPMILRENILSKTEILLSELSK